jgi:hypothetical protein
MKEQMLKMLITFLLARVSEEDVKKWADMGIDLIEDAVAGSETKLDDEFVLPACSLIRNALQIPDTDYPDNS